MKFLKFFLLFISFIVLVLFFVQIKEELKYRPLFYSSKEEVTTGEFQDFATFIKYQYEEKSDNKFIENKLYSNVGDNMEEMKSAFISVSEGWSEIKEYYEKINFDYSFISSEDYYYIENDYSSPKSYKLYYYDVENHILYYIVNIN